MKKLEWDARYFKISLYAFFVIVLSILFEKIIGNVHILWTSIQRGINTVLSILSPFIYGFFIAYIINPGVRLIEKKVLSKIDRRGGHSRLRRMLSIFIMYVLSLGFLTWIFAYVMPQITESVTRLIRNLQNIGNIEAQIESALLEYPFLQNLHIADLIGENLKPIFEKSSSFLNIALSYIFSSAWGITSGLLNILLGLMIAFYMLNEKEKFASYTKKILYVFLKPETAEKVISVGSESNQIFERFLIGKSIDSIIIGILCFIGLNLLQIRYALLISVIIGVTNMIPYFGPFIGAIPAILITLLSSPIQALWIALFIFGLQQFDGIILGPKILGDSTGLSPFWVIFAIIIGGALFGVIGMLLGVPVFAVLRTLFNRYIDRKYLEKMKN